MSAHVYGRGPGLSKPRRYVSADVGNGETKRDRCQSGKVKSRDMSNSTDGACATLEGRILPADHLSGCTINTCWIRNQNGSVGGALKR